MRRSPQFLTTSRATRRPLTGCGRRLLVTGLVVVAVVGGTTACSSVLGLRSCSQEVKAGLAELDPHEEGDLSLTYNTDDAGRDGCSHRVTTTRTGTEVATYYRDQLRAAGWRVRVAPHEDMPCSSGFGRCEQVAAAGDNVCFMLTTDTLRRRQAASAERTTLFFWAMKCSDVHPMMRSDFPGDGS